MSVARITPLTTVVDLSRRRGQVRFRSDVRDSARHVFAVDLYSHLREKHPDTHVGYWVFALPEGEAETTIGIDLTRISPGSLWKETAAGREPALDSWSNPDYVFDPILGIQLVLRRDGRVLENRFVTGRVADPEVLRSYYHRVHAEEGYTPAEPFLHELHAASGPLTMEQLASAVGAVLEPAEPTGASCPGCGQFHRPGDLNPASTLPPRRGPHPPAAPAPPLAGATVPCPPARRA